MFSGDTGNVLMPFLMNIMNGTELKEKLNSTGFSLSDAKYVFDPYN